MASPLAAPACPLPSLGHLRASEELEGASSSVSYEPRRSSPLNHLSPLPCPRSLSKSPHPGAVPRSPPTGTPSPGAPFRSLLPGVCGPSGLRRPGHRPRPPACEAAAEGSARPDRASRGHARPAGLIPGRSSYLSGRRFPALHGTRGPDARRPAETQHCGLGFESSARSSHAPRPRPRHPAAKSGAAPAGPAVAAALLSELRQRTLPTTFS